MTLDDRHRSCLDETVYREFRPDPRLRPFVECGWLRSGLATPSIRVMPDGCVDVFVTADGDVMIAGPANTFYDMPAGDQDVLAGLRLRPGAATAVIGSPASEFTNMRVPLDSVFGVAGHRMAETLFGAITPTQRMWLLGDVVAATSQQQSRCSTGLSRGRSRCCEHIRIGRFQRWPARSG